MSTLHSLKAPYYSRHSKKRVGRGQGSGLGKTAGRGGKGQKARSGNMHFEGFEGGQSPLQRRIPKRGFTNIFRKDWVTVTVEQLERVFETGAAVNPESLKAAGALKRRGFGIKVLGTGDLKKALVVTAHKFTDGAKKKIEAAGGRCEVLPA